MLLGVGAVALALHAGQPAAGTGIGANLPTAQQVAQKEYLAARARFQAGPTNNEAAWQFGRACFDFSAALSNKPERARLAREGIAACRQLIARDPDSAQGHYYLGMDLGQLADTKRNLAALGIVREMQREFERARELDEHFDFAGPDRNLGLLYQQAPVFISIGNRGKARRHLRRAVALAPDYPENRLDLIEAYLAWGDTEGARRQAGKLEKLWPKSRREFAGDKWATSWPDWQRRLDRAKSKIQHATKPLLSPRQRAD